MSATLDAPSSVIPGNTLADSLIRAQAAARELHGLADLKAAASWLIDSATSIGCCNLVATNAAARSLTTAAVLISDGAVKSIDRQYVAEGKVLIVDAATVTGSITRACATELRANGATWVGAAIYHRARPDLDGLDSDVAFDFVTSLK
jgi:hypothetical protein